MTTGLPAGMFHYIVTALRGMWTSCKLPSRSVRETTPLATLWRGGYKLEVRVSRFKVVLDKTCLSPDRATQSRTRLRVGFLLFLMRRNGSQGKAKMLQGDALKARVTKQNVLL